MSKRTRVEVDEDMTGVDLAFPGFDSQSASWSGTLVAESEGAIRSALDYGHPTALTSASPHAAHFGPDPKRRRGDWEGNWPAFNQETPDSPMELA
ncbi:hypothetical protein BGZ68_002400 [Mortierella alpina]|nr:hypothetical protein BGZ68_002400 [Mortierella alpina]